MNHPLLCIMPTRRAPCDAIRKIEPRLEPISPKRVYHYKVKIDQWRCLDLSTATPRVIVCTFLRVKSCG